MPLILTHFGIPTYSSSVLPISFFPSRCQSRYLCTWSGLFIPKDLKVWSLHRNCNLDSLELAKELLVQTGPEIPTDSSGNPHLSIFVYIFELTLSYYYKTLTLKNLWVYFLHWLEFFHQDLHRQLLSLKNGFIFQNQMFQSIILVPPWRKISQFDRASCHNSALFAAVFTLLTSLHYRKAFFVFPILHGCSFPLAALVQLFWR